MTTNVGPLSNADSSRKCQHPRCDGRAAKWAVSIPESTDTLHSCSVHLARFVEIALRQLASHVQPVDYGHRRDA